MKKKFLIAGMSFVVGLSLLFAGCGCEKKNNNTLSVSDMYGIGAVSTVKLLGSEYSAQAMLSLAQATENAAQDAQGTSDKTQQIQKFNEYFTALDSFLGEDLVKTETTANTDKTTYNYETKLTISGRDIDGNVVSYEMYYTETQKSVTVGHDETKTEYDLSGVLVLDETTHPLVGKRFHETEDDEVESELMIRAYNDLSDTQNFIEMKQEVSTETNEHETEYVYTVYKDNVPVETTAVEFEVENEHGSVETAYEIEFRNGTGKGRYSIEREVKNGKTVIEVAYRIGTESGRFTVTEVSNNTQYKYTFQDGTEITCNK